MQRIHFLRLFICQKIDWLWLDQVLNADFVELCCFFWSVGLIRRFVPTICQLIASFSILMWCIPERLIDGKHFEKELWNIAVSFINVFQYGSHGKKSPCSQAPFIQNTLRIRVVNFIIFSYLKSKVSGPLSLNFHYQIENRNR